MKAKIVLFVLVKAVFILFFHLDHIQATPKCFKAKPNGKLKVNKKRFYIKGANWHGAESETFVPAGLWKQHVNFFLGFLEEHDFNAIRIPLARDTVMENPEVSTYTANPWIKKGWTSLDVLDYVIKRAQDYNILVMLDIHRMDRDKWPDKGDYGGWKKNSESDGEKKVRKAWQKLAKRYKGMWNVFAADIANEPHGLSWDEFASGVERIAKHIHAIAPHWLIFVAGVGHSPGHGGAKSSYEFLWGGNLKGVKNRPVKLGKANRLVYTPHTYDPVQHKHSYALKNNYSTSILPTVWDDHWGYIRSIKNSAPIVLGEWGGIWDETKGFLKKLESYLNKNSDSMPGSFFWTMTGNSGSTGGLLKKDDKWNKPENDKLDLLAKLPFTKVASIPEKNKLHKCVN